MWVSYLENPEAIKAIYKESIPELNDVELTELKILFGEDIQCSIQFDIRKLPKELPQKWLKRKVSIIHIELLLVNVEIEQFNTNQFNFVGDLEIEAKDLLRKTSFKSGGQVFFKINAKWIYLQSINGLVRDQSIFNV